MNAAPGGQIATGRANGWMSLSIYIDILLVYSSVIVRNGWAVLWPKLTEMTMFDIFIPNTVCHHMQLKAYEQRVLFKAYFQLLRD